METATLAGLIGRRVRRERRTREWTLDTLAEAAGVSRRMLVNVEQGSANPSIGTLLRISEALGVGLPALVAPPAPDPVTVTPSGKGSTLWTGTRGGRGVLVASGGTREVCELWDWTLEPGDDHRSEAHVTGTQELLQVQAGTVRLEVGAEVVTLGPGDAVAFPGDVEHAYASTGHESARFCLAVFEPRAAAAVTGVEHA